MHRYHEKRLVVKFNIRGISHLEIIMSFLLFIGFVGVALWFFSPVDTAGILDSTLTYSFREIQQKSNVGIDSYSIKINNGAAADNVIAIRILEVNSDKKVRVEDEDGNVLPSNRDGNLIIINREIAGEKKNFVYLKFSEDFDSYVDNGEIEPLVGVSHVHGYYDIASFSTKEVISEKRFLSLENKYKTNYEELKEEFSLPSRIDFGFSLVLSDKSIESEQMDIPVGTEVFSNFKQVMVLRSGGVSEFGDLIVRVW